MDINRYTEKMQEALRSAQSKAVRYGNQQVDVEHLLSALLEQEGGLAPSILNKADVPVEPLKSPAGAGDRTACPRSPALDAPPDQVYITGRLQKLLTQAEDEAKRLKDEYVSVEHVLLALTEDNGAAGRLLKEFGLTPRAADARSAGGSRQPARHHRQPGSHLRSAREVRPRSDPARSTGQARSR